MEAEEDLAVDPFFGQVGDPAWNAYIGRQADEDQYVDGFTQAAIELAGAVIDKRLVGKRDALIMPILYNARHGVELSLKYALPRLRQMGLPVQAHKLNHHIKPLWELLAPALRSDEALREIVAALKPYVMSLAAVSKDGQELRYPRTRDGRQSLENLSLANIALIRASLEKLAEQLTFLQWRVDDLADERATGTFTAECSRRDLFQIAKMLPPRDQWDSDDFVEARTAIRARYELTGGAFSRALNVIQSNREMGGLLGIEFQLAHLSDEKALIILGEWGKLHPPREEGASERISISSIRRITLEDVKRHSDVGRRVHEVILNTLDADEIADIETIFYVGRDRLFVEYYEDRLNCTKVSHRARNDARLDVSDMMAKSNLGFMLAVAVEKLGRRDLGARIRAIRPDLFVP